MSLGKKSKLYHNTCLINLKINFSITFPHHSALSLSHRFFRYKYSKKKYHIRNNSILNKIRFSYIYNKKNQNSVKLIWIVIYYLRKPQRSVLLLKIDFFVDRIYLLK